MKKNEFLTLCRKVCVTLKHPDPESLGTHGRITIDGVDIALFFDEQVNPDMLFCYVDMGPVPETMRTEMYGQLLTMNLLSGAKTNGVYSLDPASGNALFVVHFMHPEQLDPEQLAQAFAIYASQTNNLRAMLREESQASTGPGIKAAAAKGPGHVTSMIDLA